jgi:peptide/nickel transport system permease protein
MSTYVAKRLLLIVPTLLGAAALVFVIMRVIPGDVALLIFGGDAGVTSLWTGRPVIEELLIRLPLSLELALAATAVSVIIAIPFGMLAAVRQDTWVDYLVRVVSIGGLAIPSFWVGILCILMLVIFFGWGPPLEFTPPWVNPWANFQMMIWPVLTVGYRYAAVTTRMTRSTVLEVLREDYIRTAWAKGLRERRVILRHAMPNALTVIVTQLGMDLGYFLAGVVVIESVFAWPGIGKQAVDAVFNLDIPLVMGTVLFGALLIVTANVAVDIAYTFIDPRVRY